MKINPDRFISTDADVSVYVGYYSEESCQRKHGCFHKSIFIVIESRIGSDDPSSNAQRNHYVNIHSHVSWLTVEDIVHSRRKRAKD